MISVMGMCMIIAYLPLILFSLDSKKYRACKRTALIAAICVPLFNNLGTVVGNISYSKFATYVYLLICVIGVLRKKRIHINRYALQAAIFLGIALLLGLLYLISPLPKPDVILMSTKIDNVYLGHSATQEARMTFANFSALIEMIILVVGILASKEFFDNGEDVNFILNTIRRCYCVFFLLFTIEWVINNFVSSTLIRDIVLDQKFIGTFDVNKVYYPRNRLGFYGFDGFYSEESYVSMLLLFFCINWVQGIRSGKEFIQYIWGIALCIMSGCTSGLFIVCFPVALLLIIYFKRLKKRISVMRFLIVCFILIGSVMCIFIGVMYADIFADIFADAWQKFRAVLLGVTIATNSELRSGAIRNFGNQVVLKAFMKSPIVGVGIGTTRGYGVLSGWLATFGLLGIFAYLNFMKHSIGLKIQDKKWLLVVILAYFTTVLSSYYVYSYLVIPYLLLFRSEKVSDCKKNKLLLI